MLTKGLWGLGIINTRLLNEALILKWAWRLHKLEGDDLCCQLLKAKYFPNKPFVRSNATAHNSGSGCKLFGGN
jgi:hypothetical protein